MTDTLEERIDKAHKLYIHGEFDSCKDLLKRSVGEDYKRVIALVYSYQDTAFEEFFAKVISDFTVQKIVEARFYTTLKKIVNNYTQDTVASRAL